MSEIAADVADEAELLEDVLDAIADALQLDVDVTVDYADGVLTGCLEGDDLGLFIGRHGQTIEAVQHLAQRIVLKGGES